MLAVLAMQLAPAWLRDVSAGILALFVVYDAKYVIHSLSLSVLIVQMNPGLASADSHLLMLRWVVLLVCFFRILTRPLFEFRGGRQWTTPLLVGGTVLLLSSAVFSKVALISLLKTSSFLIGIATVLLAYNRRQVDVRYWFNWFYTLTAVVVLTSLPLLFFARGYHTVPGSFQGIMGHPQSLGVYLAFFTAPLLMATTWTPLLLASGNLLCIVSTRCRTAPLALVCCYLTLLITSALARPDIRRRLLNRRTLGIAAVLWLCVFPVLMTEFSSAVQPLIDFVVKGRGDGQPFAAAVKNSVVGSRGQLWDATIEVIRKHPLTGVGFGLGPDGNEQYSKRNPMFGIPISSPVEYGFAPLGLVAQIGVVGIALLVPFVVSVLVPIFRFASAASLALVLSGVFLNFGEMVVLSFGDLGLQQWLLVGLCYEEGMRGIWRQMRPARGADVLRSGTPPFRSYAPSNSR